MNKSIGALVVSANEPQLPRTLLAVQQQTVPFASITHINNVVPEAVAFNKGMEQATNDWVMKIDGDMILYPEAVATALSFIQSRSRVFMYSYSLYDTFLKAPLYGVGVFSRRIMLANKYQDVLDNDAVTGRFLLNRGYFRVKVSADIVLGTHFDNPDEFQVFRRFFIYAIKHRIQPFKRRLGILYKETGNPLYELAWYAMIFGKMNRSYPTSHNIEFDEMMFNKFKEYMHENNNH